MNRRQRLSFIAFLSVVVLLISTGCTTPWDKHQILIDEYNMIMPYPDATRVDTSSIARLNGSLHGSKYESDASWESVVVHYSEQLEQNDWSKVNEGKFPQGSKCLSYKKDDLRAMLVSGGTEGGWDFAFELSWSGLQSCR